MEPPTFMSTSATSEHTILLWENRWWLPGRALPVTFTNGAQAVGALSAAWPEYRRVVRLIYEPTGIATATAECPQADRATLAQALGEQFPALVSPELAWSHEPILTHSGGHST